MVFCVVCHYSEGVTCNHDENTASLMQIWLTYKPATLLEFYICVYNHFDKDINASVKKFVKTYNLYE